MKKIAGILLILITNQVCAQMKNNIIPQPKTIIERTGVLELDENTPVFVDKNNSKLASFIMDAFTQSFPNFNPVWEDDKSESIIKFMLNDKIGQLDVPMELRKEAYSLNITDESIEIESMDYHGLFYGLQTLIQLQSSEKDNVFPKVSILDWPDMKTRGISDDISRGQVSKMENFKKIISFMAEYKLNTYMPYMEDMLQFDKYPSIGKNRGALSKAEVAEIIDFAERNFVEVIPVFQTLGHYENILVQEEFVDLAEFPGAASLNVSDDKIYEFLSDLLSEVCEMFPSEYIHVGADESFDVGLGKSKSLVEQFSIAEIHANHYKKVREILARNGKKMMMYGDIILAHPEILDLIPKDIVIVDWHYGASYYYSSPEIFAERGFNYIVSPSVWNFLTSFPANINANANIQYLTREGIQNHSLGMINSNWGDYGAETFKEHLYYGYAWSAQCSWSYEKSDIAKFTESFYEKLFGCNANYAINTHNTLSNPVNQILWHEMWRHPLLEIRNSAWWDANINPAAKLLWNKSTLTALNENIKMLQQNAVRNTDYIELLSYQQKMLTWYFRKLEIQIKLSDSAYVAKNNEKLSKALVNLVPGLEKLRDEFEVIWLKYYKNDNLQMITDKFNRLAAYLNESAETIKSGLVESPLIKSKWIYQENPYSDEQIEFSNKFDFTGKIKTAKLQLIADSYAELIINGNYVDRVYARRTLSLAVDYQRIKYFDVSKYLKSGSNEIVLKVQNYESKGNPGVNLYGFIEFESGKKQLIMTDEKWNCKISETGKKLNTAVGEYRYPVINPNFETDRTSWIER